MKRTSTQEADCANDITAPGLDPRLDRQVRLHREARLSELVLLYGFQQMLFVIWGLRTAPQETLEIVRALYGPFFSRRERKRFAALIGEEEPSLKREPASASHAILEAATVWFCGLDLPASENDLLAGPPSYYRLPHSVSGRLHEALDR